MNPEVSVIVASYNYESYIGECLNSISSQTFKNWEAIVIDDGSTDDSVQIISEYTERDHRFKLIQHENKANRGLPASIKRALNKAKGKYIAFCESDDFWASDFLERHLITIKQHPEIVLSFSNVELIGEEQYTSCYEQHVDYIRKLILENPLAFDGKKLMREHNLVFSFSSVLVKADVLKPCNFSTPYPPYLDWWLWRQIAHKGLLAFNDAKLTQWRIHGKSMMKSVDDIDKRNRELQEALDVLLEVTKNSVLYNDQQKPPENEHELNILGISVYKKITGEKTIKRKLLGITFRKELVDKDLNSLYKKIQKYRFYSFFPIPFIQKALKKRYRRYQNDFRLATHIPESAPVSASEIQTSRHIGVSCNEISMLRCLDPKNKKVLLISHEATNTGAPRALFEAAKVLKNNLYNVVFFSPLDGPLRMEVEQEFIPFIIDEGLCHFNLIDDHLRNFRRFISFFDLVIINSAANTHIVQTIKDINVKKIWWLHEGSSYFNNHAPSPDMFLDLCKSIHSIYSVGEYAISCTNTYVGQQIASNLLYGLPDEFNQSLPKPVSQVKGTIVFGILGTLEARKCQLEFVKAVSDLPIEVRQHGCFIILGNKNADPGYTAKIEKLASKYPEIKIISDLPHKEFIAELLEMDVIVSFSSDDPMPIVLTEALMNQKAIICTEKTGTSSFIDDGINGFVVNSGDTVELARKMEYIISNKEILTEIGAKGRLIYDDLFALDKFETKLLEIVDNALITK